MLRLRSDITIGSLRFTYVTNVQISSSWESLTDTAIIELPSKITNKDNDYIKSIIQVNDRVVIKLGYHPNLTTRFVGYVSKVVPESPLKIMCEDEAFQLKQTTINNYSKKNATLEDVITDNYDGLVSIVDTTLGTYRINRVTMIKVLQHIRTKYKIFSWFRNGVLYSGLAYIPGAGATEDFKFQRNIINGKNLVSLDESELNTVAHGVSVQPDGTKIELYTYYERGSSGRIITQTGRIDGDLNTMTIPGRTTAQMTALLERWLPNLYYSGFKGSFDTFGEPVVQHGDIAQIEDLRFPEKNGTYLIKAVRVEFGQGGYRQIVSLNQKA